MKKYYFYVIEFSNGIDEWEIRDVTCNDTLDDICNLSEFNEETNPSIHSIQEITKKEYNILVKYL